MKQFGACRLDIPNQSLWRDGSLIGIPPKPYAVLRYLVEHPGRLVTHDELMEALWPETYVQPQVLRTYVLELRRLLGDDAAHPRYIATLPKRGYRLLPPVTEVHSAAGNGSGQDADLDTSEAGATASELAGRDAELRKLQALMQRACAGERQIVFVTGEQGIGKTALIEAFCAEQRAGARVARGQSMQRFSRKEPYYPLKEILSELCGAEGTDKTLRLLCEKTLRLLAEPPGAGRQGSRPAGAAAASPAVASSGSASSGSASSGSASFGPAVATAVEAAPEEVLQSTGGICEALEQIAEETPLLLAFEDLHWADEATLDLISALARRRHPARLMVVATCRPEAAEAEPIEVRPHYHRLLRHDLARRGLGTVIALEPLSRPAVAEYVEREMRRRQPAAAKSDKPVSAAAGKRRASRRSGGKPLSAGVRAELAADEKNAGAIAADDGPHAAMAPDGLSSFLHQHSGGNPLFLTAIVDHLVGRRVLLASDSGWSLRTPVAELEVEVPENLREMIELDLEALSAEDQRLLEAGSVIGCVFAVWGAAAVLRVDAGELEEQYEGLTRRVHFLTSAGHDELPDGTRSTSYVFAHGFYRDVLYHRQPEVRRSHGHERLAEALGVIFAADPDGVAAEIASHYEAAGRWIEAARTLARMAHVSAKEGMAENAATLLKRAIELLGNLGAKERVALQAELRDRLRRLPAARADDDLESAAPAAAKTDGAAQRRRRAPAAMAARK
ncbi:MAG TPA: AAA family ATPase [Acidisarcina sp.]